MEIRIGNTVHVTVSPKIFGIKSITNILSVKAEFILCDFSILNKQEHDSIRQFCNHPSYSHRDCIFPNYNCHPINTHCCNHCNDCNEVEKGYRYIDVLSGSCTTKDGKFEFTFPGFSLKYCGEYYVVATITTNGDKTITSTKNFGILFSLVRNHSALDEETTIDVASESGMDSVSIDEYIGSNDIMPYAPYYVIKDKYPMSHVRVIHDENDKTLLILACPNVTSSGDTYHIFNDNEDGWMFNNTYTDENVPEWILASINENEASYEHSGKFSKEDKKKFDDLLVDVDDVMDKVFPIEVTFNVTPSIAEYTTEDVYFNSTWDIKRKGEHVDPTSITLSNITNNNKFSIPNEAQGSIQVTTNTLGINRFRLNTQVNNLKNVSEQQVELVYPMYFGFSNSDTDINPTQFVKQQIKSSPAGTYTIHNDSTSYMWLCVGSNKTINNVKSSGFEVPIEPYKTIGNYKCYRSSNTIISGNVTITIS